MCSQLYSIKYIIEGNILKVRSLIYKKDINIFEINYIVESKSLISLPAATFDKIELKYKKYDSVFVSRDTKQLFVEDLISINTNIQNNLK